MFILITMMTVISLSGCEQAVVDAEMEKLCQQDGGMKIYETVTLPKEQFTQYGDPIFNGSYDASKNGYQFISKDKEYRFFYKNETIPVNKPKFDLITWNHANLTKITMVVIRESDNKIIGTQVSYHRIGGGIIPRLGPDPAKVCPANTNEKFFLKSIFLQMN